MPDPKEAREQVVRDAKCSLILDAARKVFSEKGYWDTRLEDIAAAAGFSKASLYNYYPDKEAIFLSLAIREYQTVSGAIEKSLDPQATFEQNLRAALYMLFSHFGKHFAFVVNATNYQTAHQLHCDVSKHHELGLEFMKQIQNILTVFSKVMSQGRASGDVRSKLDDITIARYIGSIVRGVLFDWGHNFDSGDVEKMVEQIVEFFCNGACHAAVQAD